MRFLPGSALALLATLPLLYVVAKLPLHLAETLVAPPPKWDGKDRRKPRPIVPPGPPPKPGETLRLSATPQHLHWFDVASGARV